MVAKFAEELKEAREKSGLTINQVAAKSRIDIKFLEAIEKGDFSFLPELYVKAFVKDYANIIGLDPVITVKRFEAAKHGKLLELNKKAVEKEPEKDEEKIQAVQNAEPKKQEMKSASLPSSFDSVAEDASLKKIDETSKGNLKIGLAVAAVIILASLAYLIFFNRSSDIIVEEKPLEEFIQSNKQRYVEENKSSKPDKMSDSTSKAVNEAGAIADSLILTIKASDTSWVKIILDDSLEEEFILFPNSKKLLKAAKNYKITFGKSKAIQLELNERNLSFAPKNEVSHVLINKDGIQILNIAPTLN
ncbi:MAG: RodZ domain-containing protein [Ignavibacteriaceae bacterium]